ncbi:folylpolyglutamate synthase, mitochondrial-like isoform X2 [Acanthaster planci]|uniref:tetrahydrofolate synthase n=1 Tax=Acanthaster planci TaxID=133434 RepID=A0A8B7ZGX7_ACAPL|nr:folylpolyglutamate synthase, mitochondrial-like isoform X2 [Acanthaster planci]
MLRWIAPFPKQFQIFLSFAMKDMIGRKVLSGNVITAMKMSAQSEESVARNYEEAVHKLNALQSNASVLASARNNRLNETAKGNIKKVEEFLQRAGLEVEQLDDLSIIHVSGTKGKGSVCALCESMLRASGFKTGFFSSPHLVEVRERIRINGTPLPRDVFTKYFTTIFDRLEETKASHSGEMPAYFRFLTILAFHVFLKEKVDVAVVEVGIGGSYDCTNVIRKPVVVGVTSLGLDHTSILGETIEKIAWHKAAISKPGRPAFTVPQPEGAMKVVKDTAMECGASSVECAPDIESYSFNGIALRLGLTGKHQHTNASLALQLCKTWIENYLKTTGHKHKYGSEVPRGDTFQLVLDSNSTISAAADVGMATAKPFVVPPYFMKGLEECYWPGRNQTVKRENMTFYIDGAHTPRSIQACQNWFMTAAEEEGWILDRPIKRILIFNSTGDRDEYSLLRPLVGCQFDGAAFCPNITGNTASGNSADQTSCSTTKDKQLARCQRNLIAFENLLDEEAQADLMLTIQDVARYPSVDWHSRLYRNRETSTHEASAVDTTKAAVVQQQTQLRTDSADVTQAVTTVLPSIADALSWASTWADREHCRVGTTNYATLAVHKPHVQVLITGSLHLVGGVISVLDPELVNRRGS